MKLNLSEIKVTSFVTLLNPEMKKEILAGDEAAASDTGAAGLCCNIASAEQPSFCKEKTYASYCKEEEA
ncbi:MAG: hypothetical protein QG657_1685 [Acidobacteriota bacterium]|nr:hypothetical protein [Acidobacteriota bacterium]